jgi:hypothetical protein
VELELLAEPLRGLSLGLAYTLAESRVLRAGALRDLVGKQLAQDPVHRASASAVLERAERGSSARSCEWSAHNTTTT